MSLPGLPTPRRVLIIKPSSLGDVISALPVLRGLRRTMAQAHVAWLVTPGCAGILQGQGLHEIVLFDRRRLGQMAWNPAALAAFIRFCRELRGRGFDWVIDLQGLFRSGFLAAATRARVRAGFADARELAPLFYTHRIQTGAPHTVDRNIALARELGVDARAEDLRLDVLPAARDEVAALLARHGLTPRRFFLASPGTRWANKLYPPHRWRELIRQLAPQAPVALAGGKDEIELCARLAAEAGGQGRVVNLAGQTSLPQLVAAIAAAGVVICSESAAGFIAPAVGTPFVTLMGPTRVDRTGPYAGRGVPLSADIHCIGCLRRQCSHATCMQLIPPRRVAEAARRLMP